MGPLWTALILFLSGTSALIFETLWLRVAGLAFGNSVWSAALILSSFMAGLALGGFLAARGKLGQWRPLRLYALLEGTIAILGCTLVFTIPLLGAGLRPVFAWLWHHQELLNAVRFGLSFLILLIPATAMGLTLPLVVADPIVSSRPFHSTLGFLYGGNTLGAVAGALLTEGLLVQAIGLVGTALVGGGIGLLASSLAYLLSRRSPTADERVDTINPKIGAMGSRPALPWRLLAAAFASGLTILCLEVVWFRVLHLYVASSPIAFSIMLAVMLAGVGMGGLGAGALRGRYAKSPILLPVVLLLAGASTLVCYYFFPGPFGSLPSQRVAWTRIAGLAFELIFPVAVISGFLLPTIAARVREIIPSRLNATGLTLLFNTIGAAIGPLLATFVLLPAIGFQRTLLLCALTYLLLALLVSSRGVWSIFRPSGWVLLGLLAGSLLFLIIFPRDRAQLHLANARRPYEVDGSYLIKQLEGTADTLQLLRCDFLGRPYYYRLLTNGFSMSGTHPESQRYMRLFAYLPLALKPDAESVLQLCYGVGVTADAFVQDPKVRRLDIVDTSREVFQLAPFYQGIGEPGALDDPRVRTFVQDGRFFLQVVPHQYDIITGEPPPLKVAGTVNLYTREFFQLMKGRLKENGIASFWLPIYQLKREEIEAILKAFHLAFPNASLWASSDYEWIMLGINGPGRKLTPQETRLLWEEPRTRRDLARIGMEVPEELAALFLMDDRAIENLTAGVEPLTDNYPKRLSDDLPDPKTIQEFATPYLQAEAATRAFRNSLQIGRLWPDVDSAAIGSAFILRETRYLARLSGSNWLAELDFYLRNSSLQSPVLAVLHTDPIRVAIAHSVTDSKNALVVEALPDIIADNLADRNFPGAIALLEEKGQGTTTTSNDIFLLTYLYCLNGQVAEAEALAAAHANSIEKDWFVRWLWGDLQAEFGFRPPT